MTPVLYEIHAEIVAALAAVEHLPYGGEQVDQLQHALQCAAHARATGADDQLVVAALLHDVGRSPALARGGDSVDHGELAQRWLAPRVGWRVAWLAGQHVAAKRFLCTVEPDYGLSGPSVRSLRAQGGSMDSEEVERFRAQVGWEQAVALRRWDDLAKDPNAVVAPLASYKTELCSVIGATLGG